MSASPVTNYLTKKEIEENYNRSHRSLTRDFSNAVRVGDSEILQHLKLRTDDGNELVGTEVTLEMIQELSNKGLSPTWYAKQEWVQQRYSKETTKAKPVKQEEGSKVSSVEETPVVTSTSNELVATLKSQITRLELENDRRVGEHQKDKDSFMEQIKMFKDMFDTLKEDHTDTKELLKEVHQVMGKFADVSLLGSPVKTPPSNSDFETNEVPTKQDTVVDVNANNTVDAVVVEEPKQSKKKSNKQESQRTPKKKSSPSKKSKAATTSKSKKAPKTKPKQHKWYETPTLNKFLSRK